MGLSWTTLRRLEAKHGDAFFLLSLHRFERNFDAFRDAFRELYPLTSLAYSYKTNYLPALCRAVDARGGYAEVVSRFELELARRFGVEPARILFNGPLKTPTDLELALTTSVRVNLDGPAEVEAVADLARKHASRRLRVGLRCNLSLKGTPRSRFGFDPERGDLEEAVSRLRALDNCEIEGLHGHTSSVRTVESFAERAELLIALADEHFGRTPPRYLDLGGGFCGPLPASLARRFGDTAPQPRDYAEAVASRFAARYGRNGGPELILEPGVALVGDAFEFVTRIVELKTVEGRQIAQCTGSVHNVKPTLHEANLPLGLVPRPGDRADASDGPVDVVGYTCMEHDRLHQGLEEACATDDYLVFGNVGAYTLVFKPPFIRPAPPVLACDESYDRFELVRRRETLDDVLAVDTVEPGPPAAPAR